MTATTRRLWDGATQWADPALFDPADVDPAWIEFDPPARPGHPFADDGTADYYIGGQSGRVTAAGAAYLVPALIGLYWVGHIVAAAFRLAGVTP